VVAHEGTLSVDEDLAFAFDGPFTGAFREVPLREGESIDDVRVSEGAVQYQPGASAELGSAGAPNTFGTARTGEGLRIVWHYSASSEVRRFQIHYRLRGVAVAYDDVVDVNLKVWGDEWKVGLGELQATLRGPGDVRRAWGHPVNVRGDVGFEGNRVQLRALDVPAGQWVELRTLFPRAAFTSTEGMRVASGDGFERIVREEVGAAHAAERNRERIDDAKHHPLRTLLTLFLLAVGPAAGILFGIYLRFGRELDTGYDREY